MKLVVQRTLFPLCLCLITNSNAFGGFGWAPWSVSALLKLPQSLPAEEKQATIESIISILKLDTCSDTPIMLISGGEKKRVNIGSELLTDPSVLLLDEPTSGLVRASCFVFDG